MTRQFLRFAGGMFLGYALLAGFAWNNTASKVTPIEQNLVIQKGQIASFAFVPKLEDGLYSVSLKFDNSKQPLLDCWTIRASGIEWSIVSNRAIINLGNLTNPDQTNDLSCSQEGNLVRFSFSISKLVVGQEHYLVLWIADRYNPKLKLETVASIFPSGIKVHYAFNDLDFQGLLAYGFLVIGFGCFLPEICGLVFRNLTIPK